MAHCAPRTITDKLQRVMNAVADRPMLSLLTIAFNVRTFDRGGLTHTRRHDLHRLNVSVSDHITYSVGIGLKELGGGSDVEMFEILRMG